MLFKYFFTGRYRYRYLIQVTIIILFVIYDFCAIPVPDPKPLVLHQTNIFGALRIHNTVKVSSK
jgi:hypothetical protein